MADHDPEYDEIKRRLEAGGYTDENEMLLDAIEVFCTESHRAAHLFKSQKTALEIATLKIAFHLRYGETIEPGKQPYVRFPTAFQLIKTLDRIELRDMQVRRFLLSRVSDGMKIGEALSEAERRFPISYKTAEGIWQQASPEAKEGAKSRGKRARETLKNTPKNSRKNG
ncbi:hypothetical protein [Burkholderia gladioli]|uniref:hypothetical protein n=1 Tax=Burkholderia gladioli TaxID=28095 RepID=UPI00163FB1A1|nr:hypothetical protein [Burkholderia gladioli]